MIQTPKESIMHPTEKQHLRFGTCNKQKKEYQQQQHHLSKYHHDFETGNFCAFSLHRTRYLIHHWYFNAYYSEGGKVI